MQRGLIVRALLALPGLGIVARIIQVGLRDGEDLAVYHRAAIAWTHGTSPYVVDPALKGFVFKYPPWTLPLFAPLATLTLNQAKALWVALLLLTMLYAAIWLTRQGTTIGAALIAMGLMSWIWIGHASAGQISAPVLLLALAMAPRGAPSAENPARFAAGALALGAKVFPLVTLGGCVAALRSPRTWLWLAGALMGLHLLYAILSIATGADPSLFAAYRAWALAASSGGAELGAEAVRGPGSHSLSALVLRLLDPDAQRIGLDAWVAVVLSIGLGVTWWKLSRRLEPAASWAGWIALGVVVNPLAWHHSFVLTYPLSALALDRSFRGRSRSSVPLILSVLGTAAIALIIPQTLGFKLVRPLELLGLKSWGVVALAASLLMASRAAEKAQA